MIADEVIKKMALEIKNMLNEKHIRVDEDADATRIILDYLDIRNKRIVQKPRDVVLSQELKRKIENKDFGINSKSVEDIINEFGHICNKIKNGDNLNFNLSQKIFDSRNKYKDIMLNVWKIHHIHLSLNDVTSKSAMKKNRSSVLLFCIITDEMVMCLDIIQHPHSDKFFCFNLIKIVKNNKWMDKIGFICEDDNNYIPGSLRPVIENDEDLVKLYTNFKTNIAFEFDGNMYCSLDTITKTGDVLHNVMNYKQFVKILHNTIKKDDALEEITDVTFDDDCMKFFIVIMRDRTKYKYQVQI